MGQSKEEILEAFKQNKLCSVCDRKKFFDGVTVPVVAVTESGAIVDPFTTKGSALSSMAPLCGYHMIIAKEGLLVVTTSGKFISPAMLFALEAHSDADLKSISIKAGRAVASEDNKQRKYICKAIFNARKFQREMEILPSKMEESFNGNNGKI